MAEKNFRNWVGFKEEETAAPSDNAVERIRQLESQLSDLRSRRDITSLTKEEFEILATETAMSLIKTAQQRESRALASAERTLSEAARIAKEKLEGSESKARSILSGAESRGRKYLETAEAEAEVVKDKALRAAQALANESKREAAALANESKREAAALASAARNEAERIINSATSEIANFRGWLTSAITESERLYRIQTQSLSAAERAIVETKARLETAFNRLSGLQSEIDSNLDEQNRPVKRRFATNDDAESNPPTASVKSPAKKSAKKSPAKKRK
jgi:hypothetical protein